MQIPLAAVADIRVVEGPSMIKSENGLLRSYIQLRVRDRDEVGFVEEAQRVVAEKVEALPAGMYLEWTGTFEHQVRAKKTLRIVFPAVIAVIVLILYLTHKSWIDALLMMTSVLGALAGGAIFQWLFGFNFSVAVQVGYIACFGMAVETGVVMLVYLHEAIDERGGLERIGSIAELRQAILEGAIHRLRPKLLTEGAAIISIAPMLWATGVGAEVIRPMAAPVLGGLLDRRRGDRRVPAGALFRGVQTSLGEDPSLFGHVASAGARSLRRRWETDPLNLTRLDIDLAGGRDTSHHLVDRRAPSSSGRAIAGRCPWRWSGPPAAPRWRSRGDSCRAGPSRPRSGPGRRAEWSRGCSRPSGSPPRRPGPPGSGCN